MTTRQVVSLLKKRLSEKYKNIIIKNGCIFFTPISDMLVGISVGKSTFGYYRFSRVCMPLYIKQTYIYLAREIRDNNSREWLDFESQEKQSINLEIIYQKILEMDNWFQQVQNPEGYYKHLCSLEYDHLRHLHNKSLTAAYLKKANALDLLTQTINTFEKAVEFEWQKEIIDQLIVLKICLLKSDSECNITFNYWKTESIKNLKLENIN